MRKKKNTEQEDQLGAEEQEETQEETEQPQEEEPVQEQETEEQEDTEEPADEEENPQEQQEEEQPGDSPQEQSASDEVVELRRQLLEARGRNAAYAAGVSLGMVDDAVTLAMAEAAKTGEVTDASVTKAMETVLKRHPEWKSDAETKQKSGGFKLGADRDSGGAYKKPTSTPTQNMKRWNRFK